MAPEQALGRVRTIDARTDQFALAAITYAMLTGRPPFVGNDAVSLLYQVIHEPPSSAVAVRFLGHHGHPAGPGSGPPQAAARSLRRGRGIRPGAQRRGGPVGRRSRVISGRTRALSRARPSLTNEPGSEPPAVRPRTIEPVIEPAIEPVLPFDDADLPRSIDRIPHGPERTVALGLAVLGLAALIGYKGWYHGFGGRAVEAEHHLRSLAGETWRTFKSSAPYPRPKRHRCRRSGPRPRRRLNLRHRSPHPGTWSRSKTRRRGSRWRRDRSGRGMAGVPQRAPLARDGRPSRSSRCRRRHRRKTSPLRPRPKCPPRRRPRRPTTFPLPEPEPSAAAPDLAPAQQ